MNVSDVALAQSHYDILRTLSVRLLISMAAVRSRAAAFRLITWISRSVHIDAAASSSMLVFCSKIEPVLAISWIVALRIVVVSMAGAKVAISIYTRVYKLTVLQDCARQERMVVQYELTSQTNE